MTKPEQEPVEHQRLEKLQNFDGGRGGIYGCGLFFLVIMLASAFYWPKMKGDYVVKSQISEGMSLAYRVRAAFDVYLEEHGEIPTNNKDADLPPAGEINGKYVTQIRIDGGEIIVVYGKAVDERVAGKTLVFVPDVSNHQDVSWTCTSPDIPGKWLLEDCQNN